MTKWIEVSGKNEATAIASALSQLGLDRDDVSVEVLERAKSGFLGIGAAPARIKVSYEVPDEPKVVAVKTEVPAPAAPRSEKPNRTEVATKAAPKVERPAQEKPAPAAKGDAAPAPLAAYTPPAPGEMEEKIHRFLGGLLVQMNVQAELKISARAEGGYQVFLEGEHLGALIGHRGETLDSIQQLTNYCINRDLQKRVRVHIDVENYRQKREESLQHLANKVASKVVKYRRNITLEPMNAYERHVIHEALETYPDVMTYSTGTEPNRRTVVAYTKGKHTY